MRTLLPLDDAREQTGVRIPFPLPAYLTLRAAGDMRRDGDGRGRFYSDRGVDPGEVFVCGQIHSRNVAVVPAPGTAATHLGEQFIPDTDGLITADPDLVLAVTVADCAPIFVLDRRTGTRALLHSGWKGTGILAEAIDRMSLEFGTRPDDLTVTIGPCISAASYLVDDERAAAFAGQWGEAAVQRTPAGPSLDLRAANQEICRRRGVDLINVIDHCTVQEHSLGSFRREGPGEYTLMLAMLGGGALEKIVHE